MKKMGRKSLKKVLLCTDWIGVLAVAGWIFMGVYLWCKFWRIA